MNTTPLIVACGFGVALLGACSDGTISYEQQLDIAAAPPGLDPAPNEMVYSSWLPQGVTIVLEDRSGVATAGEPVYIACDANEWAPDDPAWRMMLDDEGRWTLDIEQLASEERPDPMRYKFTRGSWESVECHADGADVINRRLPFILRRHLRVKAGERPELKHAVDAWVDGFEERPEGPGRMAPRP